MDHIISNILIRVFYGYVIISSIIKLKCNIASSFDLFNPTRLAQLAEIIVSSAAASPQIHVEARDRL